MTVNLHAKGQWGRVDVIMARARQMLEAVTAPQGQGLGPDENQWKLLEAVQRQAQLELLQGLSHDLAALTDAVGESSS